MLLCRHVLMPVAGGQVAMQSLSLRCPVLPFQAVLSPDKMRADIMPPGEAHGLTKAGSCPSQYGSSTWQACPLAPIDSLSRTCSSRRPWSVCGQGPTSCHGASWSP